jgi:hypothetical protein
VLVSFSQKINVECNEIEEDITHLFWFVPQPKIIGSPLALPRNFSIINYNQILIIITIVRHLALDFLAST